MKNSDLDLVKQLKQSVRQENRHLAQTLRLLAEVVERRVHLAQGYATLYEFCVRELCLSEGSVYRRTQVVAKIRKYPALLAMIEKSQINLTVAALLCPHLDKQTDAEEFLRKFVGKTKRAAEDLLVDRMAPRPSPRDDVRRLPDREVPRQAPDLALNASVLATESVLPQSDSAASETPSPKPEVIREKCYQFNFAASERLKQKLDQLKDALAHKYPAGRLEHIIEEAVDHLILAQTPKAKRATTPKPSSSRYNPIKWKELAFQQAGVRCEFVGADGRRCSATRFLQIDHRHPLSMGGRTELSNLQVLCAAHNLHKAKCDHGAQFIERKISARSSGIPDARQARWG